MVERFGSGSLLVVTATLVALLAVGMGAACDKDARAEEGNTRGVGPASVDGPRSPGDETNPVGGGPGSEFEDDVDTPIAPGEQPHEPPHEPPHEQPDEPPPGDQRPDELPPTPHDLGEDDSLDPPAPVDRPDEDESSAPDGSGAGEEGAPDEENWRAPVQSSGGDDPPDYIVPSDPKHV